MKRLLFTSLVAVLGTLGTAGQVAANGVDGAQIATFKNVSGNIGIARNESRMDAVTGMPLYVSDRIVSSAGASGGIVFNDGTQLTVGPSTDIQVRDYTFEPKQSKYEFFVYLAKGAAVYTSGMIGRFAPEVVKVATPTATIGIRGTKFIIEAD
jgi:hypothetical protein